jgi:hypothetical protein
MKEEVIPPRMYQGPRQEKQHRKKQRQLQQNELQNVYPLDKQQNTPNAANTLSVPAFDQRLLPAVIQEPKPQPRAVKKRNIQLVILAYSLGITGLGINGWFAYTRGVTEIDKLLMCSLGFFAEAIMFFLPSQIASYRYHYGRFIIGCVVYVFVFAFALTNSLGFASLNLHDTATARAERITPAVSDAQRRLDTLSASRASECLKRGDKCRQLEKDEQTALEDLTQARREGSAKSDPQVLSASKLITWLSLGRYNPTAEDFAMLRLLLLTLLPQLGGIVLMLSSRN